MFTQITGKHQGLLPPLLLKPHFDDGRAQDMTRVVKHNDCAVAQCNFLFVGVPLTEQE